MEIIHLIAAKGELVMISDLSRATKSSSSASSSIHSTLPQSVSSEAKEQTERQKINNRFF